MRGKPFILVRPFMSVGLIPAHAGKTARFARAVEVPPAHPRACGENPLEQLGDKTKDGSSPRMRGKPSRLRVKAAGEGLIPAHAGKTFTLARLYRV